VIGSGVPRLLRRACALLAFAAAWSWLGRVAAQESPAPQENADLSPSLVGADPSTASAATLLSLAEEAMSTIDYQRSRDLAERAIAKGGLEIDDLVRGYRILALSLAQLDNLDAAEKAFIKLYALEPSSKLAMRLSPARRGPVLNARGFWSLHKDEFGVDVTYGRRERQLVVQVRDELNWGRIVHVWSRFGDRPYTKSQRAAAQQVVFDVDDVGPTDALDVYAFVVDDHGNVLMRFGREREPHVFRLSDEELAAILRRDIRGGQTGSYARRLEELGVQVGVHGYASLELKPNGDTTTFDLHHATAMIRANLLSAASVEIALEWEHLGTEEAGGEFYLPHAFIDIRASDLLVIRGGFFEAPVGAFNEYLYPDFLRVTGLPPLFSQSVVPGLWSEVGLQARGRLAVSPVAHMTYAAFVSNGLQQRDPNPTDGVIEEGGDLREMRFNAREDVAGNKAVGGRLGLEVGEFDLGMSGYTGPYTVEANRQLSIIDADLSFRSKWLTIRTEGAVALQETTATRLNKNGLYALAAVRAHPHLEPYAQYDYVDVGQWMQRGLLGFAFYPFPHERATSSLRLKSEGGYEFTRANDPKFVWFFQLTTGF
jgi:tetratricopeptide (TPR) repeat protein